MLSRLFLTTALFFLPIDICASKPKQQEWSSVKKLLFCAMWVGVGLSPELILKDVCKPEPVTPKYWDSWAEKPHKVIEGMPCYFEDFKRANGYPTSAYRCKKQDGTQEYRYIIFGGGYISDDQRTPPSCGRKS